MPPKQGGIKDWIRQQKLAAKAKEQAAGSGMAPVQKCADAMPHGVAAQGC
jgi:hypothetical protein